MSNKYKVYVYIYIYEYNINAYIYTHHIYRGYHTRVTYERFRRGVGAALRVA